MTARGLFELLRRHIDELRPGAIVTVAARTIRPRRSICRIAPHDRPHLPGRVDVPAPRNASGIGGKRTWCL
jgi:hypothetical protein